MVTGFPSAKATRMPELTPWSAAGEPGFTEVIITWLSTCLMPKPMGLEVNRTGTRERVSSLLDGFFFYYYYFFVFVWGFLLKRGKETDSSPNPCPLSTPHDNNPSVCSKALRVTRAKQCLCDKKITPNNRVRWHQFFVF